MENRIITGTENVDDLPELLQIISLFYRAFNNKDLAGLRNNWATSGGLMIYNPGGGVRKSWEEIEVIYKGIFNAEFNVKAEFSDYTVVNFPNVFVVYGKETATISNGAAEPAVIDVRITRIYNLISGAWKQIHLHGSIDNPEALALYQRVTGIKNPVR